MLAATTARLMGEENEEDMALVQLGIDPEDIKSKKAVNGTSTEDNEEDAYTAAAIERIGETKEKSPFVAEVIGDVCPEAEEEDEREKAAEVVEAEAPKDLIEPAPEGTLDAEVVMDFSEEEMRRKELEERQKEKADQLVEAAANLAKAAEANEGDEDAPSPSPVSDDEDD